MTDTSISQKSALEILKESRAYHAAEAAKYEQHAAEVKKVDKAIEALEGKQKVARAAPKRVTDEHKAIVLAAIGGGCSAMDLSKRLADHEDIRITNVVRALRKEGKISLSGERRSTVYSVVATA